MSEIQFYHSMTMRCFHQNVKIPLLNECSNNIPLSEMVPYWRLIFLKGFKLRLKGIFELDLQNGHVNEDLRTVEANIC